MIDGILQELYDLAEAKGYTYTQVKHDDSVLGHPDGRKRLAEILA